MKTSNILVAGIAGTTAFTLFSYLMSELTGEPFKQPVLIRKMIRRKKLDLSKQEAAFAGWLTHYLIGIGFAAAYEGLIDVTGMKPNLSNGVFVGAASAIPAALSWHTSLELHPAPPQKKSPDYYFELAAGHIIFGAVSFMFLGNGNRRSAGKSGRSL